VLDPTWRNPYAPSVAERHHHERVVRRFAMRRRLPQSIVVAVIVVAALAVGVSTAWWLAAVAVVAAVLYAWDLRRAVVGYARRGETLGASMLAALPAVADGAPRQRLITVLDRLAATFGVDGVSAFIVADPVYNAALVPDGRALSFFVTSALMQDFELIELEGVVAHCLARQRLGLLERESLAAVLSLTTESARAIAGEGGAYRADEVAAASIRYPLGLAAALRRCGRQSVPADSFFVSAAYAQWRWVFFNQWSDRAAGDLGDLDDVELRARALEEW
jgi:hypothetical protein